MSADDAGSFVAGGGEWRAESWSRERGDIFVNADMATQLDQMASLFQALGDGTRLRILGLLLAGEVCVCDIYESLKIPQSKASRHLAYLRKAGLVDSRRDGLWIHYRLASAEDPALQTIAAAVRHALTHVDAVKRDGQRLKTRTGRCLPSPLGLRPTAQTCCVSDAVPVRTRRERS